MKLFCLLLEIKLKLKNVIIMSSSKNSVLKMLELQGYPLKFRQSHKAAETYCGKCRCNVINGLTQLMTKFHKACL